MLPTAIPAASTDPGACGPPAEGGTLDFLLRRMRHSGDFPALSGTFSAVNRAVASDDEPTSVLCAAILRDFALANKLLRVVNAAHCRQFGGAVSTVSRAIAILGQEQVRSLALSLVLIEHLQDRSQAGLLCDEVTAAYLAGLAARELAAQAGLAGGEEAFLAAMFHRLGRLLAACYLHEEAQAVDRLMAARGIDAERASQEVLGLSYARLGAGVARQWGFPEAMLRAMEPPGPGAVRATAFAAEPLRVISSLAAGLVDVAREPAPDARRKGLAALESRFGAATGVDGRGLASALEASARRLLQEAPMLGLASAKSPLLVAARGWAGVPEGTSPGAGSESPLAGEDATGLAARLAVEAAAGPQAAPVERHAGLAAGVQEVAQALVGDFVLNDVLRMILETAYRAGGFARVLLFVRERSGAALRLRLGFGEGAEAAIRAGLAIPLAGARDVFHVALSQGADVAIENLADPHIRAHVPAWHAERLPARGMLLFPVIVRGKPVALLYADADRPEPLRLAPGERDLLKTLRNQAVLAIRQGG